MAALKSSHGYPGRIGKGQLPLSWEVVHTPPALYAFFVSYSSLPYLIFPLYEWGSDSTFCELLDLEGDEDVSTYGL